MYSLTQTKELNRQASLREARRTSTPFVFYDIEEFRATMLSELPCLPPTDSLSTPHGVWHVVNGSLSPSEAESMVDSDYVVGFTRKWNSSELVAWRKASKDEN